MSDSNDVDPGMAADWAAANADVGDSEGGEETTSEEISEETVESAEGSEETGETSDEDVDAELAEDLEETDEDAETVDPAAELENFKKLAEKLGFAVNDKGVTKRDLAAFTDKKRRTFAQIEKQKAEFQRQVSEAQAHFAQREQPISAFMKALEDQDLDEVARIAGFKDGWNELQGYQLKRAQDPSYHEVTKIKKEREAEKAELERQRTELEARQKEENRVRGLQQYKMNLSKTAAESKDILAKTMHDDRMFIETVFSVQKDLLDPLTGRTVSIEAALDVELPNGKTLRQNLKAHYDKLASVFGGKTVAPTKGDNGAGMKSSKVKKAAEAPVAKVAPKTVVRKPAKRTERDELNDELAMFARKMSSEAKKSK
jgi:hypothetical protein